MTVETIRDQLPDYARDLKLNLGSVLTPQGAPGLSESMIASIAVSTAIAARNPQLVRAIETWAEPHLDAAHLQAARSAAAIMGMNNIYYRFQHVMGDESPYAHLPARLRMEIIGKPGVGHVDFTLWCLAASLINGCDGYVRTYELTVREHGGTAEQVQDVVRIASVIHAVALMLDSTPAV